MDIEEAKIGGYGPWMRASNNRRRETIINGNKTDFHNEKGTETNASFRRCENVRAGSGGK